MRKINLPLLLVAIFGIGAAFVSRPLQASPRTLHTYNFLHYSTDRLKMFYGMDLTDANYQDGIDYACFQPSAVCTFIGNPASSHSDLTGNWFYTSDVPVSGIDDNGTWFNLD
ncbi:MAG TPA: hypothetical protein VGM89_06470 [Puia sp.]|jgi:hypothetical protein